MLEMLGVLKTVGRIKLRAVVYYLKHIIPIAFLIYIIASIQMLVILGIEFKPQVFIAPTLVGIIFGTLVGYIRVLNGQLAERAVTDSLTGLYNRLWLDKRIDECLENYRRYHTQLSVIMIDVDNFKQINDQYGHNVGDDVLRYIAELIRHESRVTDNCIRWGGEEFLIVLPSTELSGAQKKAEALRRNIEKSILPIVGRVTCSFGVTEVVSGDINKMTLMNKADQALYQAKNEGKNCVCAVS